MVQGRQILRPARPDAFLQPVQRLDAARQRQPHQQHRQRQDDKLRQHHPFDNFRRQHTALFAGFGHLHQGHGVLAAQRQAHPHGSHADVDPTQLIVPQHHVTRRHVVGGVRQGEITFTAQQLALGVEHLEKHHVRFVGAQNLRRGLGQVELNASVRLFHDELRQRMHVVLQRTVKGLVGQRLRHQPGQRQTHRPQQQQGREHPVQNFSEQGTLLTLKNFHHTGLKKQSFWSSALMAQALTALFFYSA